jgi:hypothetical protein
MALFISSVSEKEALAKGRISSDGMAPPGTVKQMSLVTIFEPLQSAKAQADLSATLWARLRHEAEDAFARERALVPIFVNSILNRSAFEDAVIHRISARLGHEIVPAYLVNDLFGQAVADDETIGAGFRADIVAALDRDPACERLIEPLLYFKGFHAIQRIGSRIGFGPMAGEISRFICRAGRPTCFRPTSIRRRRLARASSLITRPGSWSARRASSTTMFRSSRMSRSAVLATKPATGTLRSGAAS